MKIFPSNLVNFITLVIGWTLMFNCKSGVDENQLLHLAAKLPVNTHSMIWMCESYYMLERRYNTVDAWKVKHKEEPNAYPVIHRRSRNQSYSCENASGENDFL